MKPKQTTKTINWAATILMILATGSLIAGCKKENLNDDLSSSVKEIASLSPSSVNSPWLVKSIGISAAHWSTNDMSAPDQTSCYGLLWSGAIPVVAETHDGGDTWEPHAILGLQNNFPLDISSRTAQTAHVIGWNYVQGGGNIIRTEDGGLTWQEEGANAFTSPASFPDVVHFFSSDNGV